MDTQTFISQYLNDARIASGQLGIPVSAILAQWIDETGSGSSSAFNQGNNYAGVSNNGQVDSYPDKKAGLLAYIQRWGDPVYGPTRTAIDNAGNAGAPGLVAAQAIEASPWAGGHYNGHDLENIITSNNLTQYDKNVQSGESGGAIQPPPGFTAGEGGDPGAAIPGPGISGVGAGTGGGSNAAGSFYGCPEGKVWDGPSFFGSHVYITKCMGRAWLGGISIIGGLALVGVGLGIVALGSRPGRALTGAVAR